MKKYFLIIAVIVILFLLYCLSYFIFGGFPIGYSNNHLAIYKYDCADSCPLQGYWYKEYYGDISNDECVDMGGDPVSVGLISPGLDDNSNLNSSCRVK